MKEDDEKRKKREEDLNNILKKQEEERKKYEPIIREAQERERKIQEEQRKIEEEAKKRNIEIERLNGKINDNLSKTGFLIKSGAVASTGSFLLGTFLDVAGVSISTSFGSFASNVLVTTIFSGFGVMGLSAVPLLLAGGYALKKLTV